MSDTNGIFSPDWEAARARFRAAVRGRPSGALELPDGHTIDWAWTGDPDGRRVAVFTSGVHGVEGFGGSAAQLDMLAQDRAAHPTLWIHVVNPWGMANLRRVNAANVDLNRNCLAPDEAYEGADPAYALLDPLLNPKSPPTSFELVYPQLALLVARHGWGALKNALLGGQYTHPQGLFHGGACLQPEPAALLPFLERELSGRERVAHIDLHSGLGQFAARTLVLESDPDPARVSRAKAAFGPNVRTWDRSDAEAYSIRGSLIRELERRVTNCRYDALICEFGTWSGLSLLFALRAENRLHHWGAPRLDHWAKVGLKEAFAPDHPAWRGAVVAHARALRTAADALLATD